MINKRGAAGLLLRRDFKPSHIEQERTAMYGFASNSVGARLKAQTVLHGIILVPYKNDKMVHHCYSALFGMLGRFSAFLIFSC